MLYRLTDDEIWIARIWDTRRDPADLRVPDDALSSDSDEAATTPGSKKLHP